MLLAKVLPNLWQRHLEKPLLFLKEYDDKERTKAEKDGNKRRAAAFSSESNHATMMMDDLKKRVKNTEKQV